MKKKDYMKVNHLKDGWLYRIRARNARFGIWREKTGEFLISRFKFYDNYIFPEIHADLSEWHGTAFPLEEIEKSPFDPEDYDGAKMIEYLNEKDEITCSECGRRKDEWIVHEEWCKKRTEI
jgi:hypothetical protein